MNELMEQRAEAMREHFPAPRYRVELHANETQIWVVNEETHHVAEIGEYDFALDPEGAEEISYIHTVID